MPTRFFIAVLLFVNYLLVVGTGCMNRPEDQRERLLVRITDDATNYQECRYLRMDGLETFLAEALSSRFENKAQPARHHLLSVVWGVDAHHLPVIGWTLSAPAYRTKRPRVAYVPTASVGVDRDLYTPPWLG